MQTLSIALIQTDLAWEDKSANLLHLQQEIAALGNGVQVVVLPEMFSTGFSMQPELLAETMDGPTVDWMKVTARTHRKIITGSLIIKDGNQYFNRLIWMQPNGQFYHYNKRHLFAYAGEDNAYTAGEKRLLVQVNGWKICLMVCYDLRFPVWSRQNSEAYDVLIYVANWPERRSHAWKTLLQARAIENQAYVVGVNRVGTDGHQIAHSGDSCLVDPLGQYITLLKDGAATFTYTLEKTALEKVRKQFPFLDDADKFVIV